MPDPLAQVETFHRAFGCFIKEDGPGFPPGLNMTDRAWLEAYAAELASTGRKLKWLAQVMNEKGRAGLGLLLIRCQLQVEETAELVQAMADQNLVEAFDALADIAFVTRGTALTLGLQGVMTAADDAVFTSNMSKLGEDGRPIISAAGRVVKGPNYAPPTEALKKLLGY
jgi:predicted HAD superfamily Cof-like phosphohydrolase